jgi:hypothetical protein
MMLGACLNPGGGGGGGGGGDDDLILGSCLTHAAVTSSRRYEGAFDNGRKHGVGRMEYSSGDTYQGDW